VEPESVKEIDLTPNQLIAANLEALGLNPNVASGTWNDSSERVLEMYKQLIRETGRLVTATEVSDRVGLHSGRVSHIARELYKAGRMVRMIDRSSGKPVYVPKVV